MRSTTGHRAVDFQETDQSLLYGHIVTISGVNKLQQLKIFIVSLFLVSPVTFTINTRQLLSSRDYLLCNVYVRTLIAYPHSLNK